MEQLGKVCIIVFGIQVSCSKELYEILVAVDIYN